MYLENTNYKIYFWEGAFKRRSVNIGLAVLFIRQPSAEPLQATVRRAVENAFDKQVSLTSHILRFGYKLTYKIGNKTLN